MIVVELANVIASVSIDTDGVPMWLLLAGPASAVAVYSGLYRYYRNTDKSHSFEKETSVEAKAVTGGQEKVDQVRGTTRKAIQGNNVSSYRQRVQRIP